MDANDQLDALFAVAQEQQATAKAAADAMAHERTELAAAIQILKKAAAGVQKATGEAASRAVVETLAQSTNTATTAVNASTGALNEATKRAREASTWLGWKLALVLCLAGAGAVGVNYAIASYTSKEIRALRAEKADLEANIAALAQKGGRIKLSSCGPKQRLCVRTAQDLEDTWTNPETKARYVVPYGY